MFLRKALVNDNKTVQKQQMSLEGIKETFLSLVKKFESADDKIDWSLFKDGKLDTAEFKDSDIVIKSKYASLFTIKGKPVSDLKTEINRDIDKVMELVSAAKASIIKHMIWSKKFYKDVLKAKTSEEYTAVVKKYLDSKPPYPTDAFNGKKALLLGWDKEKDLVVNENQFTLLDPDKKEDTVTLPKLNKETTKELISLGNKLMHASISLRDIIDSLPEWDDLEHDEFKRIDDMTSNRELVVSHFINWSTTSTYASEFLYSVNKHIDDLGFAIKKYITDAVVK